MVEDVGRQILFSGCAHARSGAPPRRAAIALAKALQLDSWEAPNTGCCGARADRKVGDEARQKALGPLYDGARQGLDITCLSPACGRVVAGFVAEARGEMGEAVPGSGAPRSIRVGDMAGLLHEAYGFSAWPTRPARTAWAACGWRYIVPVTATTTRPCGTIPLRRSAGQRAALAHA